MPRAFAALTALLLFFAAGNAFSQEKPVAVSLPEAGAVAHKLLEPGADTPGFVLKDVVGTPFDFGAEKARSPVLLVFFSIFCEPCRRGLAAAQRLQDRFGNTGLRVAAVALDGEPFRSSVLGFAQQERYGFRVLMDETDAQGRLRVADLFGVAEIPMTFLVEKGGQIVLARKGSILEGEIEKFLAKAKKP